MHRGDGSHALQDLAGDQRVAGLAGVAQSDLERIEPARLREAVHLRLVGEARLDHAEPAHRPAREVVGASDEALDDRVRAPVGALGVGDRVEQHRRRGRGVRPAVEQETGLDLHDLTVTGGVMAHPDPRRVPVDVAEEALGPAVLHPHRTAEPKREQAAVDLQADVFAGAERSAHAAEHQPHPLLGQREAGGDLLAILVQPLGGDVQLDPAAVVVGNRQRRFQPEERLVLHSDLVGALDDDVARGIGVAAADRLVAQHVAVRVDRFPIPGDRLLGVDERGQHVVLHVDGGERPAARLRVVGRDGGDGLADVAHEPVGEHRLVLGDQPVGEASRHVGGGQHGVHAGDRQRRRDVDRHNPRVRVRGAEGGPPRRAVHRKVGGELERTVDLRHGVGAGRRIADPAAVRRVAAPRSASWRRPSGAGDGDPLDRIDDPAVAGAAADVARQLLGDLDRRRIGDPGEQIVGRHDQPGGAEAALHRASVDERLLDVGRRVPARRSLRSS